MLNLNYIRGITRFEIVGISPERFINIAIHRKLRVFGFHCECGRIYGCVPSSKFPSLMDSAEKAGVQLEITDEYGLPSKLRKYKSRSGFIIGAAMFCFILWYLSLFVWSVTTVNLPQAYAVSAADAIYDAGIRTGALCSSIDGATLQMTLESKLPAFDLITVSRLGCYAEVHFSPSKFVRSEVKDDTPCDIVATDGGEIIEIIAETGTPLAVPGDIVYPGDVLISGVFEGQTGGVSMVHSDGKVTALVDSTYTETVDITRTITQPTGRVVTVNHIYAFGMELPLFLSAPDGNYSITTDEYQAKIFGLSLPFTLRREYLHELCYTEHTFTTEECIAQAEQKIESRISKDDVGEIVSQNQTVNEINGGIRVTRYITASKEISCEREILISPKSTSDETSSFSE